MAETASIAVNVGGSSSSGTCGDTRYDAIRNELRLLSDLHHMRERRFKVEEGTNGDTPTQVRGGGKSRGTGRTRTLKPRHLGDFDDDDFDRYRRGSNGDEDEKNSSDVILPDPSLLRKRFAIFNRFARSVCHARAIARKEIFEAWAMALYVHETFLSSRSVFLTQSPGHSQQRKRKPIKRFADLACSHGLLSWALLLLASSEEEEELEPDENFPDQPFREVEEEKEEENRLMTAVCIDISMPKCSETAAGIFFQNYPQFRNDRSQPSASTSLLTSAKSTIQPEQQQDATISIPGHSRWDYVEGPIENIVPHESTLLVGIHACGRLSDTVIDLAIATNAPLALVPCCHSKKILTPSQAETFAALVAGTTCRPATTDAKAPATILPSYSLADFMDGYRKQRLIDEGYTVRELWIPEEFTPKNRILLAIPPIRDEDAPELEFVPPSFVQAQKKKKPWGVAPFGIPLRDAPEEKATLRSLSGRAAADQRKNEAHPPPAICVSVWLPLQPSNDDEEKKEEPSLEEKETNGTENSKRTEVGASGGFTAEALQKVLENDEQQGTVRVEDPGHKPCHRREDGRASKTLRIHYLDCRNNKAEAKARLKILREVTIPRHFPAVMVRGK